MKIVKRGKSLKESTARTLNRFRGMKREFVNKTLSLRDFFLLLFLYFVRSFSD